MSFAQDEGYIPVELEEIISDMMDEINTQFGTSYTDETFLGTNWYKFCYAIAQKIQENEVKTSEIFLKLQEYIATTNEKIQRPSVTFPGIIDAYDREGYVASYKQPSDSDRGRFYLCVDVDHEAEDYPEKRLEICTLLKDYLAAGIVTMGDQTENITLSNGQSFPFSFYLPNRIPVVLRLTLTTSENNLLPIPSDEDLRQAVFDAVQERYKLGLNFEPQRYFELTDAPWASTCLLEWSDDDGGNWHSTVYDAAFDDLFEIGLEDIEVNVS